MGNFETTINPLIQPAALKLPAQPPTRTEMVPVEHRGTRGDLQVNFYEVEGSVTNRGYGGSVTVHPHTKVEAAFLDVVDGQDVVNAAELRVRPPIGEDEERRQQTIDALLGVLGVTRTVEAQ